jgi:ABC-2 type transport system ATP-binding protein
VIILLYRVDEKGPADRESIYMIQVQPQHSNDKPDCTIQPAIEFQSLTKKFKDGIGEALKDLTFSVQGGQICGLIGPNGAGKTTVLRIAAGLDKDFSGWLKINNFELNRGQTLPLEQGAVQFVGGLCMDQDLSVWANCMQGMDESERFHNEGERIFRNLGLWEWRETLLGTLSQGYRQKVALAAALICDPKILLLDEPASSLDLYETDLVFSLIKQQAYERGAAVLLSTRRPQVIKKLCDRVVVLRQGRLLVDGAVPELRHVIRGAYYRIRIRGELDCGRSAWFDNVALVVENDKTILFGDIKDQAALHGLLAKVRDLGLELISVERFDPGVDQILSYLMQAPVENVKRTRTSGVLSDDTISIRTISNQNR